MVDISSFDLLIFDCIALLNEMPLYEIFFVRRSVNQVTHILVKKAVSLSSLEEWYATSPLFINDVLLLDVNQYMD